MKKILFYSILLSLIFCVNLHAQERKKGKKLPPTSTLRRQALIDSLLTDNEKKSLLPKLGPKEYTIIGDEKITREKRDRIAGKAEFKHLTGDERSILKNEADNREVHYSGSKKERHFQQNIIFHSNEAYAAYGKYDEVNAGVSCGNVLNTDEIYVGADFQRSSGHLTDAGYTFGNLNFHDAHQFSERFLANFDMSYDMDIYKFYSGDLQGQERKRHLFSLGVGSRVASWNTFDVDAAVEGRIGTVKDLHSLDERGFTGEILGRGIIKNSTIKTNILYDYHDLSGIKNDNSLQYLNGNAAVNTTIGSFLKLRLGVRYFHYSDYTWSKRTRVYPDLELDVHIGPQGEFYAEYNPGVKRTSLSDFLTYNRYIDTNSGFSYEDIDISVRSGWRKQISQSVMLELYYTYMHYENVNVYIEPLWDYPLGGIWEAVPGFKTEIHGVHASAGFQWGPRYHLVTSLHLYDYGELEDIEDSKLPYRSEVEGELLFESSLGYGFFLGMEGTYLGDRYTDLFWENKIDPVFLLHGSLKKRFSDTFQIEAKVFNIFDSDYEYWRGFSEPDLRALGGLRVFF